MGDNPFSFGGGYRNGGLSEDAMVLLRSVWSFDYMGAAEFEFGAVPKALHKLAEGRDHMVAFDFTIPKDKITTSWRGEKAAADGTIHVLCSDADREEVQSRIEGWAGPGRDELKEPTLLAEILCGNEHAYACGWLELNNGFLFFTDRRMWEDASQLFGVDVDA